MKTSLIFMKTSRLFLMGLTAFALAACKKDMDNQTDGDMDNQTDGQVAAKISANIKNVQTRAAGQSWEAGDKIGITCTSAGKTNYTNVLYTIDNPATGSFSSTTPVYFQDLQEVTFSAYYPYNAAGGLLAATTDATAQQNRSAIDFLFASGATGDKNSPVVSFTDNGGKDNSFHHRMSWITLTFEAGDGVDFSVVKPERYTLGGLILSGTFNTADGIATADDGAQTGELTMNLADGNLTSSVILFPQTAASLPLIVNYKSQEYHDTLTVPEGALQAGNNYTYTVKVNATGLNVSECTIDNWGNGGSGSGNATMQ